MGIKFFRGGASFVLLTVILPLLVAHYFSIVDAWITGFLCLATWLLLHPKIIAALGGYASERTTMLAIGVILSVAIVAGLVGVMWWIPSIPQFTVHNYKPVYPPQYPIVPPLHPKTPPPIRTNPAPQSSSPLPETPPQIVVQPPYGNLAQRCNKLGEDIIAYADNSLAHQPSHRYELDKYNRWYSDSAGFFRGRFDRDIVEIRTELTSLHFHDRELEDLLEEMDFHNAIRMRARIVDQNANPEAYNLSAEEFKQIGEGFKRLASQIPH